MRRNALSRFDSRIRRQEKSSLTIRVVDVGDEVFNAGIDVVEIGDDGNVGRARPACGERSGGGVVTVDMEDAGAFDPFAAKV